MDNMNTMNTKTVQGVGINDVKTLGLPKTQHHAAALKRWHKMLERVYTAPAVLTASAYAGVTIAEEWLTFSKFAKWFDEAATFYGSTDFELDKDLVPLTRGLGSNADRKVAPRVYGPKSCVPIHHELNVMLTHWLDHAYEETRGIRELGRSDGAVVYRAKYNQDNVGVFTTQQEAAYELIKHRQRQFLSTHHLQLKRLHSAGLIGCRGDKLIDVKNRLALTLCPLPEYSIMEDKSAPIRVTERRRGKPATTCPERPHWVVRVHPATANRVRVKRFDNAALAISAISELSELSEGLGGPRAG